MATALMAENFSELLARRGEVRFYQVREKFRNELRCRTLARCREFVMKDGYSAHLEESSAARCLAEVARAYLAFFEAIGLPVLVSRSADTSMGEGTSFEFFHPDPDGESSYRPLASPSRHMDVAYTHEDGQGAEGDVRGYEVGHIFLFGDRYSKPLGWKVEGRHPTMGSYGIGMNRVLEVSLRHRGGRLHWSAQDAPFDLVVVHRSRDDGASAALAGLIAARGLRVASLSVSEHVNANFTLARELFSNLKLVWISGQAGSERAVVSEAGSERSAPLAEAERLLGL